MWNQVKEINSFDGFPSRKHTVQDVQYKHYLLHFATRAVNKIGLYNVIEKEIKDTERVFNRL